ncbi:MAG: Hpt domain-containing protein [Fibrobacteria bacterium]
MDNRKILNREFILQVEKIKPGLAERILEIFLGHAPGRFLDCQKSIASGDWHGVENATHILRSSAGQLGAEKLQDICDHLGKAAETGLGSEVSALAAEFASVYAETMDAMRQERSVWTPHEG